jgi:hypothetical protein
MCAIVLLLLLGGSLSIAQLNGKVQIKERGIEFIIPAGWVAEQASDGYYLSSADLSGIVAVLFHDYHSVENLQNAASEGFVDDEGTSLFPSGEFKPYGKNGVSVMFTGTAQWQAAKAYAIGLVSPYGGGLTVLGAAGENEFSTLHKEVVSKLAASIVFSKVPVQKVDSQWKQLLTAMKLTYLNSYSSGGGSGGYSDREVIDLCPDGRFGFYSTSSTVVNSGAGAYSASQGGGAGTWTLKASSGETQLILRFNGGEESKYTLEFREEKLYLNGYRYFRTNDAECN